MPERFLKVVNLTRNTSLGDRIELANSPGRRNRGLLGREQLEPGEGLWIVPCEAVHTFGMSFAIDLIYLDKKHRVRKLCENLPPWRLSGCFLAHSVLELPSGSIRRTFSQKMDLMQILFIHS